MNPCPDERSEKSGRDRSEPAARIFFSGRADVAVSRELESWTENACVAPRNNRAYGDTIHPRQL